MALKLFRFLNTNNKQNYILLQGNTVIKSEMSQREDAFMDVTVGIGQAANGVSGGKLPNGTAGSSVADGLSEQSQPLQPEDSTAKAKSTQQKPAPSKAAEPRPAKADAAAAAAPQPDSDAAANRAKNGPTDDGKWTDEQELALVSMALMGLSMIECSCCCAP